MTAHTIDFFANLESSDPVLPAEQNGVHPTVDPSLPREPEQAAVAGNSQAWEIHTVITNRLAALPRRRRKSLWRWLKALLGG